jgi:hypothetical protein
MASAAEYTVVNLTGTNWVNTADTNQIFPPGVTRMPDNSATETALNAWGVASGQSWVLVVDNAGETIGTAAMSDDARFWQGFGLVFVTGLVAMGARWVRKILGGSGEACEET